MTITKQGYLALYSKNSPDSELLKCSPDSAVLTVPFPICAAPKICTAFEEIAPIYVYFLNLSVAFCISGSIFWDQGHYYYYYLVKEECKDEDEDLWVWGSEAWRVSNEALPK